MGAIKNLIIECQQLKAENKALLKKISYLEKQIEELLKQDTSLKY